MAITLQELAISLNAEFSGNPDLVLNHVCGLDNISEGGLCYLTEDRNIPCAPVSLSQAEAIDRGLVNMTEKVAVIVKPGMKSNMHNLIYAEDPLFKHVEATKLLHPSLSPSGKIHPTAVVGKNVKLGAGVSIDAYAVIYDDVEIGAHTIVRAHCCIMERTIIGEGCILYPHVVIREDCRIGDRVVLHASAIIGSDGHGYFQRQGKNIKLPQVGAVVIGNDVEIGSCTTIDRGRLESTVLGNGCKLDNQVQIGHNVEIGPQALISGQSAIGGSTKIGSHLVMGGQSGIIDHVKLGDHVTAIARTAITSNTASDQTVAGMPSRPLIEWRKIQALTGRLTELFTRLRKIEEQLDIKP